MRRDRCGGCGSADLEPFLDLGKTPLADRFPTSPDEPETWYPLELAVCTKCWLVQLLEVVADDELWADYGFYSGTSPSSVAYFADYAAWALERFGEQARRLVLEIACNDGELLQHFQAAGAKVLGVDPAYDQAVLAAHRGLHVLPQAFTRDLAEDLLDDWGAFSLIIANNVAAHVADPNDFIAGIAELLAPDGVAVVEAQYLPDLLAGNQFDHVYHEHRFYFSVGSLASVAWNAGLRVAMAERTSAQGGSIRFGLEHRRGASRAMFGRFGEPAMRLDRMDTYSAFQGRVEYIRERLLEALWEQRQQGRRIAGYGATAKSTTLLNFCGIGPDLLEYVEDTTPAKIDRYTPGMHIPIVGPGEREHPDTFLLLAWNYLPGVLRRERVFMDQGGRFLVPVPVPVLL